MQRIVTHRMVLERPATRLADRLWTWQVDSELQFLSDDSDEPSTPEEVAAILAGWTRMDRQDLHVFTLLTLGDENPIGYVQVANIDPHNQSCDIGLLIGEKQHWGRGLGREALTAAIAYCFDDLGLNRIGAEIYAINARSVRLFEACGFRREGTARDRVVKVIDSTPCFVDGFLYSLLRRDWGEGLRN